MPRSRWPAMKGSFLLQGYAGNTAADHVNHLHCLPEFLRVLDGLQG